ncbi:hypothetical protein QBC39DRAFT_389826 [Podospora conica]|nr:hypothetical protein QBC39DRAFT_389826 [Schizothecium conicum]
MLLITRVSLVALWVRQAATAYDATVCDQRSYTSSENMTFNANAWNPDGRGFQCIAVQDSPPAFEATWAWTKDPQSVHSYPHVKLAAPALPVAMANISALHLSARWSMGPGWKPVQASKVDTSGLASMGVTANVAFDMFADRNPALAGYATTAETEIMVWIGRFGAARPLGFTPDSSCSKQMLGDVDLLYRGRNQRGTNVFTWVATTNDMGFSADMSPLLQPLWRSGLISPASYIGVVEFGSEAFHSPENVTFLASGFDIHLRTGTAPTIEVGQLPISCSLAAATHHQCTPAPPWEEIFNEKESVFGSERNVGAAGERKGPFRRCRDAFRRTYCPAEEPSLVLPTGPTDEEKLRYITTNRIPLYIFGLFSFLTLSAGMWLFAVCAPIFAWYGVFVGFLNIYLIISYLVGVIGRDWDYAAHIAIVDAHPITDDTAPTVDVYLPCCSEPLEILENTYRHVTLLDWPAAKLKIHVLDDGNQPAVRALAARYGFGYLVRDDRPRLRKAGNLRWAFARTDGDFFAIFDADFCPRPDFLRELVVEHMADEGTAIVQSPQFFRVTPEQTWVEQGAGATQELFYRVVQVNRNKWGASICVGSNAVYRRAALEAVGGTAEIGFSEDVHTGFDATDRGWTVKYVPLCLATGICPNTPRSFFSQQMRWARGSTTLLTTTHFWTSRLTLMQKVCYLCGLLYYSAVSLGIFISPIPGTLLLVLRPEWFKYYNLAFAIPSIVYGGIVFRYWSRATYGFNVQHVMVVQSYAYLTAIKDRLFGIELLWAASGDKKAHKSNKYRNMRLLCWAWTIVALGGMVAAVTYRLVGGFPWYHTVPLIVLNVYNLYICHYFLFASWRW